MFKLDEVTSAQRVAIYSQRRGFLTSSDDGLRSTYTKYVLTTGEEIIDASYATPNVPNTPNKGKVVDPSKLVAKLKQFFPTIALNPAEISVTSSMVCMHL